MRFVAILIGLVFVHAAFAQPGENDKPLTEAQKKAAIQEQVRAFPAKDMMKVAEVDGVEMSETERGMLEQLNAFRKRNGLAALRPTANLMSRARKHASWMAGNHSMTHSAGIQENIAMGQRSPASVTDVWINSGGHNANMRTGNKEVGLACAISSSGTPFWVQQFASGSDHWGKPKVTSKPIETTVAAVADDPSGEQQTSSGNHSRRRLFRRR